MTTVKVAVLFALIYSGHAYCTNQATAISGISAGIGICGVLYYYAMEKKERNLQQQQEKFINQLILDQHIEPSLRESIRAVIKHYSASIKKYTLQKNLAILPLLICAAGFGYVTGKGT